MGDTVEKGHVVFERFVWGFGLEKEVLEQPGLWVVGECVGSGANVSVEDMHREAWKRVQLACKVLGSRDLFSALTSRWPQTCRDLVWCVEFVPVKNTVSWMQIQFMKYAHPNCLSSLSDQFLIRNTPAFARVSHRMYRVGFGDEASTITASVI